MAYYDGDFDQFLKDRLKSFNSASFPHTKIRPRLKKGKNRSIRFNRKLVWLAVSYLVVIALLFGSFGTAYAAMDSLPNELLYAVKLAGEDLQLLLTTDMVAQISLLTTFSNRWADEATILASLGQPVPEQVSLLIDKYQEKILALSVDLEDEQEPEVGIFRRPQDQDNEQGGTLTGENAGTPSRVRDSQPVDLEVTTLDLEIPDPSISITDTIGISGTTNMTQTSAGENWGPGPCETVGDCDSLEEEHSPGPYTYSYSSDEEAAPPHAPGTYKGYGPGYAGDTSQQPPPTNPLNGNGSSNQTTENKVKKP